MRDTRFLPRGRSGRKRTQQAGTPADRQGASIGRNNGRWKAANKPDRGVKQADARGRTPKEHVTAPKGAFTCGPKDGAAC